jgi:hypothetical protein
MTDLPFRLGGCRLVAEVDAAGIMAPVILPEIPSANPPRSVFFKNSRRLLFIVLFIKCFYSANITKDWKNMKKVMSYEG